jgi:hypothetical protein
LSLSSISVIIIVSIWNLFELKSWFKHWCLSSMVWRFMDNTFSEVGPTLLKRPAWGFEIIHRTTVEAICSTQEPFLLLWWNLVFLIFFYIYFRVQNEDRFRPWHQKMRKIDIFQKVICIIQNSTVFPKPNTCTHAHTHTHTHRNYCPALCLPSTGTRGRISKPFASWISQNCSTFISMWNNMQWK